MASWLSEWLSNAGEKVSPMGLRILVGNRHIIKNLNAQHFKLNISAYGGSSIGAISRGSCSRPNDQLFWGNKVRLFWFSSLSYLALRLVISSKEIYEITPC